MGAQGGWRGMRGQGGVRGMGAQGGVEGHGRTGRGGLSMQAGPPPVP